MFWFSEGDNVYYTHDSKEISEKLQIERQMLHAYSLSYSNKEAATGGAKHQNKNQRTQNPEIDIDVKCPYPEDFQQLAEKLKLTEKASKHTKNTQKSFVSVT